MKLLCLGSSSKGNCYILKADNGNCLIIEAGVSFLNVKKAIDYNVKNVVGCIISHSHLDHAGFANKYQFIDLYMSSETSQERGLFGCNIHVVEPNKQFNIDEFSVIPFDVPHDVRCFGYLIHHKECGNVLFITDFVYTPYTFNGLNNILLECNYRLDILESNIAAGRIPAKLRDRTIKSHCSLNTCKEILQANDLSFVNNIVLIHLSDGNSNATDFQRDIQEATGKTVHIANKGMTLKFNKTPF